MNRQRRPRSRRPKPEQRLGARGVYALVLAIAFGSTLLWAGMTQWHDRSILLERGQVVTAEVVEVHSGRGVTATVRFTTTTGAEVVTDVADPPDGLPLRPGSPLDVSYDPLDPHGRVAPLNENQSAISRWFLTVSGIALVALGGYGTFWWTRETLRRR